MQFILIESLKSESLRATREDEEKQKRRREGRRSWFDPDYSD